MNNITFHGKKFQITYQEIYDIILYIKDEFPDLIFDIDNSFQSSLIYPDHNSFVILFQHIGNFRADGNYDPVVLYYLEPKIFKLIEMINSQLKEYDLYISASDFGQDDTIYELVVTELGTKPTFRQRYNKTLENSASNGTTSGMGTISSPGVSSTSVAASSSGSGDVTFTLNSIPSQKMGNPSQVSDLRYLKRVKIKRVKDF